VSTEANNKALVRRSAEAYDKGDLETLDKLLAPDFVDHSLLPGQETGREGYMRALAEDLAAFSHRRSTIEYQATDGDMVITRLSTRTIHDRGAYLGMAPTGREHETQFILLHRIVGGKIAEEWSGVSPGGLLEDLAQEVRQRERVEQELRVARRIQQASLPKEVPTLEGWQINPYYRPAREVGGDFYDFHILSEGRLGLVVGTQQARASPQRWLCPPPAGCYDSQPRAPPRPGRCSNESTRRSFPTSLLTCSSPASTPSSTLRADA
jgi:predicted ester cyclase